MLQVEDGERLEEVPAQPVRADVGGVTVIDVVLRIGRFRIARPDQFLVHRRGARIVGLRVEDRDGDVGSLEGVQRRVEGGLVAGLGDLVPARRRDRRIVLVAADPPVELGHAAAAAVPVDPADVARSIRTERDRDAVLLPEWP
jgi:hypothetical protein